MTLKKYHTKRDFKKTPEPKGKVIKSKNNLFIIQKHAASHLHYDFRLELHGVLLSWAVPKGPCLDPSVKRLAMHVEDHPVEYGSFEGVIPKGQYGGGTVMLWDKGTWESQDENPTKAYQKGSMTFRLNAVKLHGLWKLIRMHGDDKTWLLFKIKDEYARPLKEFDITEEEPDSVKSQKTIDEIAENYSGVWTDKGLEKIKAPKISLPKNLKTSRMPKVISPQLATLADDAPAGKEWLHEIKFDGYRILAFKNGNDVRLMTRNNNDWTDTFKTVAEAVKKLPIKTAIFDGEVVVLNERHHSDFQLLQNSIKEHAGKPFLYYIFDLLYVNDCNIMDLPLLERKKILESIIPKRDSTILRYSDHIIGNGQKIFTKACKLGLEGIVSKNVNSHYLEKRSKHWIKVKCTKRQEFVIAGFTPPQGSRSYFGSLLLGTYNKNKELIYNGNVGTGFTESSLKTLHDKLKKNITSDMPFKKRPPGASRVTWVKPVLTAEVAFSEWTSDGCLRHPSFKGLRTDKPTKEIIKEVEMPINEIETSTYHLTNPNKILYPEDKITKGDIANYYETVSEWILPYISNRPLALVRCPDGYQEKQNCFFQKHVTKSTPDAIHGIMIKEKETRENCIYIDDIAGLMALAQQGTLEIHPWGSTIKDIEHPDWIIFDLDPAPDVPWKRVVAGAFEIRDYLKQLKLKSFVKTTGGKGLHVVIPIKPKLDWEEIKEFTHAFVNLVMQEHPKEYVTKMTKATRTGKIFLDYLRNQRGATAVAPYSPRAREHATVATPLHWDELTNNFKDIYFTVKTLPKRLDKLRKDPWADFFKLKQLIKLKG